MARGADPDLELAKRVAAAARELGIETALIGAAALAVHRYVRATVDTDLATHVTRPHEQLGRLRDVLASKGLHVELRLPDEDDDLGGVLEVWEEVDEDGVRVFPVEVVNFFNPYRPGRPTPARDAVRNATALDDTGTFRCVRLPDLIVLKLQAGSRADLGDVVELLVRNPDADMAEIEALARTYGLDAIARQLIDEAKAFRR